MTSRKPEADVCKVLEIQNPSHAATRLKSHEKTILVLSEGRAGKRGGAQSFNIINEPGFYRMVLRSDKPVAEEFQTWVVRDVLPSIRKTGAYSLAAAAPAMPNLDDPETRRGLLLNYTGRVSVLTRKVGILGLGKNPETPAS